MLHTADEIIQKQYKGHKNFMTPDTIRTGLLAPDIAYELSHGTGMQGEAIYAVAVVSFNVELGLTKGHRIHNRVLYSLASANQYVRRLTRAVEENSNQLPEEAIE